MHEWGVGSYEDTASELAPAAEVAVAALGLRGGERVLDVACGTATRRRSPTGWARTSPAWTAPRGGGDEFRLDEGST